MASDTTNPKDLLGQKKPPLHLVPPVSTIYQAMAMKDGAKKYGPFNWREKQVSATVYIAAAKRHLDEYLDGEENARDSGVHHLAHALASIGIILDARECGCLIDDRPKPGAASDLIERFTEKSEPVYTESQTVKAQSIDPLNWDYNASLAHSAPAAIPDGDVIPWRGPGTPLRKPRCYIAGPMRGYPQFNFPAFDAARDIAIHLGWEPISPADLDRENGIHEDSTDVGGPEITREFVTRDTNALISLRAEYGDAIVMLPGWERSTGAVAEFFVARWLGLKILNSATFKPFTMDEVRDLDLSTITANIVRTCIGAK